jgi:hypothetical protein
MYADKRPNPTEVCRRPKLLLFRDKHPQKGKFKFCGLFRVKKILLLRSEV